MLMYEVKFISQTTVVIKIEKSENKRPISVQEYKKIGCKKGVSYFFFSKIFYISKQIKHYFQI